MSKAYFKDGVCVGVMSGGIPGDYDSSLSLTKSEENKIQQGAIIGNDGVIDENAVAYQAYLLNKQAAKADEISNANYSIQAQINAMMDLLNKLVAAQSTTIKATVSSEHTKVSDIASVVLGIQDELELNGKDADFSSFE